MSALVPLCVPAEYELSSNERSLSNASHLFKKSY